jgi:apolipoprotein N-acyltransferase
MLKFLLDRNLLIAVAAGVLMSCAAPPLSLWGLAWIALVPLWMCKTSGIRSAIAWGLAYHGLTLHWITGLHPLTWLGVPWVASVMIVAFVWLFVTLWGTAFVCAWVWGLSGLRRWNVPPMVRVLAGTGLWCGLETLRQQSFLDWTTLALTQSPHNLAILHLGQISGSMAVTAAIVAVNGLIAETWTVRSRWVAAIALLLALHGFGFWLYSQPLTQTPETALKVGIVQINVPTRIKLFGEGLRRALIGFSSGYRELADQKVDAVLTSEGALPFLWEEPNRSNNLVYKAILEKQVPMWLGTFVREGSRYTQSLLTLDGKGETIGRYNKVKLVALAEYLPFENILGGLIGRLSPISSYMQPGDFNQQFNTPFGRATVGICYDSAFPELFRLQVARGAQFLLTAANLDPYSEVLMMQQQAHDVMRSIESDRWSARSTNTGYSGIIDPHGRIIWRSQPSKYEIHAGTIYRRKTQTLYVYWGDWLTPTLLGVSAITIALHRRSIP